MSEDPLNILFVGVYRDGTGYSHAAIDYMMALIEAGANLACRPLKLNPTDAEIPPQIIEAEQRKFSRYDAVIQNLLPHHMEYDGDYPVNVGLFFCETTNFRASSWASKLNCLDLVWVCCEQNAGALRESGVTTPYDVLPVPMNSSVFTRSYDKLNSLKDLSGNFLFLWVGEFGRRKNIKSLLQAFHLEFDVNEPVSLVLKVSPRVGEDDFTGRENLQRFCDEIKSELKLYSNTGGYKQEIIIPGRFSDEEIMRLHASCDCGVYPSYCEAWGRPAFDSMAMGKTPIVTDWGGFRQYMTKDTGWLVDYKLEPVFGTQKDTFADLHTGREHWASIDIDGLRKAMREAYQNTDLRKAKGLAGKDRAFDFTYSKVGSQMIQSLQEKLE